jgi:hypothetical protein
VHYETLATSNATKKRLSIFLMLENFVGKLYKWVGVFSLRTKKMQGIRRDGTSSCIDFANAWNMVAFARIYHG